MLNVQKVSFLVLMAVAGATSAVADVSTSPVSSKKEVDLHGRCRFEGIFDNGKNGTFASVCEARFAVELKLRDRDAAASFLDGDRDRDHEFLKVVCNNELIYADGVRARILRDHDRDDMDGRDRDREFDLLVSGLGERSPRILIDDVKLRHRHDDLGGRDRDRDFRAVLRYQANGFVYTLQGRCELEQERHDREGGGQPLL